MKPIRSALFVPGHKADWIEKALRSESDAVIIDLEDSVPEADKALARQNARAAIAEYAGDKTLLVRPNALDTKHFAKDILEAGVNGLGAFLLPKLFSRDDMIRFDAIVTAAEIENEVPNRSIELIPTLETAASINKVDDLLTAPRVGGVMAAAAKDADVSREVGFKWSESGFETLYLRSKVVVAARSAGLRCIILGLWQDVKNLEGLAKFADSNSALGYTGQVIIHPSHAPAVNQSYGLTQKEIDYYQELVSTFYAGVAAGHGAVLYNGEHIDLAHALHAQQALALQGISVKTAN